MSLPISAISDNFDDNVKSAIWGNSNEAATATKLEDAGNMLVFCSNLTSGLHYGEYYSQAAYDLTGGQMFINIDIMVNTATNAQQYIKVQLDSLNYLQFVQQNGSFKAQKTVAGVTSDLGTATYDYATYRWVRIRESGGTTYFDYSADGKTWKQFVSTANVFAMTSLYIIFGAGTFQSETNPGVAAFDNFNLFATAQDVPKTHVYQVFQHGTYKGNLPNVSTEFSYTQQINQAACALEITVGMTADTSNQDVEAILTEDGQPILTELGEPLLIERQPDLVGGQNSNALIANNNDVVVYEYSALHPAGIVVFRGFISKWSPKFATSEVALTVLSYGWELDKFMIEGGESTDVSQASQNTATTIYSKYSGAIEVEFARAQQNWLVGSGITLLEAIEVWAAAATQSDVGYYMTLLVYSTQAGSEGLSPTFVAATSLPLLSTTAQAYKFVFPSAATINPAATYWWQLKITGDTTRRTANVYYQNTDVYANGLGRRGVYPNGQGGVNWTDIGGDFYFKTYTTTNAMSVAYSAQDPAAILRDVLDKYAARGGTVIYTNNSIDNVGTSVSYTFKVNTILEGVQKVMELAPSGWYWYVDPASNVLHFHNTATTAAHTFILGKHLMDLDLVATIENLENIMYFTGGPTAGVNLFTKYTNSTSVYNYRAAATKMTDNRVTDTTTGQLLATNESNDHANEEYNASAVVLDPPYDISKINIGDNAGFGGFGTFIDGLILQIVQVKRSATQIELALGILPPRQSKAIEDLMQSLRDQETVANPTSPS